MTEYTIIPYLKHRDGCPIAKRKLSLIKEENPIYYKIMSSRIAKDTYLPFRKKYINENGFPPTKWAIWKFNLPLIFQYIYIKAINFLDDYKPIIIGILLAFLLHSKLITSIIKDIIKISTDATPAIATVFCIFIFSMAILS